MQLVVPPNPSHNVLVLRPIRRRLIRSGKVFAADHGRSATELAGPIMLVGALPLENPGLGAADRAGGNFILTVE